MSIDEGIPPNGDGSESKMAVSFDTESTKSSSIQAAPVFKGYQVTFIQACLLVDKYIPSNPGSKEAIIKNRQ